MSARVKLQRVYPIAEPETGDWILQYSEIAASASTALTIVGERIVLAPISISWSQITGVPPEFTAGPHASTHQHGGSDEVATEIPGAFAIPKADSSSALDAWISAYTGDVTKPSGGTVLTISNDVVTFAKMQNIATDRLIGRDTAGSGDPEEISVGGNLEFTGTGGIQRSALTGDVTASAGSGATTIPNDTITFAKFQNIATDRLVGRDTAGSGDAEEIAVGGGIEFTGAQALQTSAFTGDVTKAAGGTALTIPNDTVDNPRLSNMATQTIKGRNTAGTGDPEDLSVATVRTMLSLTDELLLVKMRITSAARM